MKIIEGSSSDIVVPPVARRRFQMTVGKMMTVILVAGCLVGLFVLLDRAMQPPVPRRAMCTNNLKQIGLGLDNFAGGLVALLAAMLFPMPTYCNWPAARRAACVNNLILYRLRLFVRWRR